MNMFFTVLRCIVFFYVLAAPFVFIYLQQKSFLKSFDDELGNKLIVRLYLITVIASIGLFALTLTWQACSMSGWGEGCILIRQ